MQDPPEQIAGFTAADLAETARRNFDLGSDAELPASVRFHAGVMRLLRKRYARAESAADPIEHAWFLLGNAPPATHLTPFVDDGSSTLAGRIWFVNEAVHSAKSLLIPDQDPVATIEYIASLGYAATACVVLNPAAQPVEARFYPKGLVFLDEVSVGTLEDELVAESTIRDVVDRAYRQALITPGVQLAPYRVWDDARKWRPVKAAEMRIAGHLAAALQGHFVNHRIRRESSIDEGGRVDIIFVRDDYVLRNHRVDAVLELKILRSYWSSGIAVNADETRNHVDGGVEQAHDYKTRELAESGMLYCFDMRRDDAVDDCYAEARTKAGLLDVILRSWRLFNSSRAKRSVSVQAQLRALHYE